MPCTYCAVQFTLTRWKSSCNHCGKKHCSDCMINGICRPCNSVQCSQYRRLHLMQLKVKDLRLYLQNRDYSTEKCREKFELVSLIQRHVGIYEPDLECHTERYDTSHHTRLGGDNLTENSTTTFRAMFATSDIPEDINNFASHLNNTAVPEFLNNLSPPTYSQTQDSFPTAQEFASTSSRTDHVEAHSNPSSSSTTASQSQDSQKKDLPHLSDIMSPDEIHSLSIKQLKHLLRTNFVNFQGILERQELIVRVETLFHDHRKNSEMLNAMSEAKSSAGSDNYQESKDANLCKICWDSPVNCVYLECGHMVTCIDCSKAVKECPICRQNIIRTVRVFKS